MKSFAACRWLLFLTLIFVCTFNFIYQVGFNPDSFPDSNRQQIGHLNSSLVKLNNELKLLLRKEVTIESTSIESTSIESTSISIESEKARVAPTAAVQSRLENFNNPKIYSHKVKELQALIFTMDSITSYEQNSRNGGAAGEILIRKSLQDALKYFGVKVRVATSDQEFEIINAKEFDIIILDPWTWAAKGWVPKRSIVGLNDRIFVLDFFGSKVRRGTGFNIPNSRVLTAFGSPWNPFLGFYRNVSVDKSIEKKSQGVIWGKDPKHYQGRVTMLQSLANTVRLISTATSPVFVHENVEWMGHASPQKWDHLLSESKFLIGLGDPLLGPSAIDAIIHGCVYINPIYAEPVRDGVFDSQHPYASNVIGFPYVCSYHIDNFPELKRCVDYALTANLKPHIPAAFTWGNYTNRVQRLFNL